MDPRIIINAKVYEQVNGLGALQLAQICSEVASETGTAIGLAPPMVELGAVGRAGLANVAIFAQHVDPLSPGSGTGHTTIEAIQGCNVLGSILNHAEHKIDHELVAQTVPRLSAAGLQSLVCADGRDETKALAPLHPTYIAVEPPELIGGDVSVTSADPTVVSDAVTLVEEASPTTKTLCGAGVKTGKDVATALELGAFGVLLASGVVKHADPRAAILDLARGL